MGADERGRTAVARRFWVWVALAGVICLGAAAATAPFPEFYRLRPLVGNSGTFTFVACVLFLTAFVLSVRQRELRAAAIGGLVVIAGVPVLIFLLVTFAVAISPGASKSDPPVEVSLETNPDGSLLLFALETKCDYTCRDYTVRTDRGLASREFAVGCVNLGLETINSVTWIDARTLRFDTKKVGITDVIFDDVGRPDRQAHAGC